MKILDRYILRAHVGPFFFGLAVIMFVLIMDYIIEVLAAIIRKGLDVFTILQLFALNLAWMLALAIPMAVLVSTLMAFGRMSQDNEITALKSSGVSLYRLISSVLVASLILFAVMVFFNDRILPELNHQSRLLATDIHQKRPTWNLRENVFIDEIPEYHILLKKVDPHSSDVEGVTIYDEKNRRVPRTIIAERGKVEFTPDGNTLVFRLFNGEVHEADEREPGKYRRISFDKQTIYIHNVGSKLHRTQSDYRTDREKTSAQMLQDVERLESEILTSRQRITETANLAWDQLIAENQNQQISLDEKEALDDLIKDNQTICNQILSEKENIKNKKRYINSLMVEVYKKFALAAACVVFILVGAPLGVMARRGGIVGVALSLGFFVLYWAFLIGGEELADRRLIPAFLAMWSANILIGGAGIYILIKSARESRLFPQAWSRRVASKIAKGKSN
jgi:lipopolysaccharide export system permease protein